MKTYECTECGREKQSKKKPTVACACGARGKWKQVESFTPRNPRLTLKDAVKDALESSDKWHSEHRVVKASAEIEDYLRHVFMKKMLATDGQVDPIDLQEFLKEILEGTGK